jgi:hypothetical protein
MAASDAALRVEGRRLDDDPEETPDPILELCLHTGRLAHRLRQLPDHVFRGENERERLIACVLNVRATAEGLRFVEPQAERESRVRLLAMSLPSARLTQLVGADPASIDSPEAA